MLARTAELTNKITRAYADFEFHRVYHLLNEFCNSELSALYLDVLKDRLYTLAPNHPARRSAQSVIYKITDALARLTAPILSFTADEVWQSLPGTSGSVHLTLFPKAVDFVSGDPLELTKDWEQLLQLRTAVLVKLESLRAQKIIGKSLEAIATIQISASDQNLRAYASSLPELFNVSEVDLVTATSSHSGELPGISVERSEQPKCERCWRAVPDVGRAPEYPTVCLRCAEALAAIDFPAYATAAPTTSN